MSGILKDVRLLEGFVVEDMLHPINMLFIKGEDETEVYPYQTSVENQFCSPAEMKNGLRDDDAAEKLKILKSYIGKTFDINLYKFPVSELTDGKFVAVDDIVHAYFQIFVCGFYNFFFKLACFKISAR